MRNRLVSSLMLFALLAGSARAEVDDLTVFEHIPVQENGRIMPIDTYARNLLLRFNGKSTFNREPASKWLLRTWTHTEEALDAKCFLVNNPEVLQAVGLEAEERSRYSFNTLEPVMPKLRKLASQAMEIDANARSPVEAEIVQLYHNLFTFQALSRALDFAQPQAGFKAESPELKTVLGLEEGHDGALSFLDLWLNAERMAEVMRPHQAKSQEEWPDHVKAMFLMANQMRFYSQGRGRGGPAMVPLRGHDGDWLTPWTAILMNTNDEAVRNELAQLQELVRTYRDGNQVAFDLAARALIASVSERIGSEQAKIVKTEVRYNKSKAFYRAETLYGFGFLFALIAMVIRRRWIYVLLSLACIALAVIPHTYGIVARMIIMQRPPVTNLYSTFVFVGWCGALLCLALEYLQRNRLGLISAAFCGLSMLLVSGRFATDGDTMGVMVAVLDSNFWLATHVITITMGYAGCVVAGVIGHIYIFWAIFKPGDKSGLDEIYRAIYGTLAFGLIFSWLGTMLGGVWADQSWGRFWGWDPKENGALVIVIWSAIIFHAKLGKLIGPLGFAACSVIGIIGVLSAWVGVNLLGVGLHSYGFTSSLAMGFVGITAAELLFLAITVPLAHWRKPDEPDFNAYG